jgi:hypothetical protein
MRKIKNYSTPKEDLHISETRWITVRGFLNNPTHYIYLARKGVVTVVQTSHGRFLITPEEISTS